MLWEQNKKRTTIEHKSIIIDTSTRNVHEQFRMNLLMW
jgi:hypothetical protein